MATVLEEVPVELRPRAEGALAWINQQHGAQFKLTGVIDAGDALDADASEPVELGLVLCEGDVCLREQVRIQASADGYQISSADSRNSATIPPHLDPPEGVRQRWLDDQLAKHRFILIVFYRGLW